MNGICQQYRIKKLQFIFVNIFIMTMISTRRLFSTVPEFLQGETFWFGEARHHDTLMLCEGKDDQLLYLPICLQSKIPLGRRLVKGNP